MILGPMTVGMKLTIPTPRAWLLGNEASTHGKASVRLVLGLADLPNVIAAW
jgi:hypothetical protein